MRADLREFEERIVRHATEAAEVGDFELEEGVTGSNLARRRARGTEWKTETEEEKRTREGGCSRMRRNRNEGA